MITAKEMDAAWFNALFAETGLPANPVVQVHHTQIGTGQIGKCYRFDLKYEGAATQMPTRLVGKFPSDNEASRATGVLLRNYYTEVRFYQQFAQRLSLRMPHCFYADIEGDGPNFVLLLEDMAPAVPGDQLLGCTAEVARAAVLELVGLQVPFWCDPHLKSYDYLWTDSPPTIDIQTLYVDCLPTFFERYGSALTQDERRIIEQVGSASGCPLFTPPSMPFCLEHVDYRLDNMLIDNSCTPPKLTVIDWQSVRLGKPMNDVAYFLGAGLQSEVRRPVEADIVRAYHQSLLANNIVDYSWENCWRDYRQGTFSGFGVTVIASTLVEETARGNEMFKTMARRHARHALDLRADEFLN